MAFGFLGFLDVFNLFEGDFTEGDDEVEVDDAPTEGGDLRVLQALDGDDVVWNRSDGSILLDGGAGSDTLYGGGGADLFRGGDDDDVGYGGEGDDAMSGDGGDDTLYGREGDDALSGDEGLINVILLGAPANPLGPAGDDVLYGGAGLDTLRGDEGRDTLYGGDDDDDADGEEGDDRVYGGRGDDEVDGGDGNDLLFGGEGRDTAAGGDDDDTIFGGAGADELSGGAGDDVVHADGADLSAGRLEGGQGYDVLSFRDWGYEMVFSDGMSADGFERIEGSDRGDAIDSRFIGEILGQGGDDTLSGSSWGQTLDGGDGADVLVSRAAGMTLIGGAGGDVASYATTTQSVDVDLGAGVGGAGLARGDVYIGVEHAIGSNTAGDRLAGDGGVNRLEGRGGGDRLEGRGGADSLFGGSGEDTLEGGAGGDLLDGGAGVDAASYRDSGSGVTVYLDHSSLGGIGFRGDAAYDKLRGIENLTGSYHGDLLFGDDGDNELRGEFGDDVLDGGGGSDTLVGGVGDDTLVGGADADVFRFGPWDRGEDLIVDFEEGVDVVEIVGGSAFETEETADGLRITFGEEAALTVAGAYEVDLVFV